MAAAAVAVLVVAVAVKVVVVVVTVGKLSSAMASGDIDTARSDLPAHYTFLPSVS